MARPNMGLGAMPELGASVQAEVAHAFKAYAKRNNTSVRSVIRDLLYDFAREEMELEVADLPRTKMTHK